MNKVAQLLLGLLLLGIVFYAIGFSSLVEEFKRMDFSFLPHVVFFLLAGLFLSALNIQLTTWPLKKMPLKKALEYYAFSWSAGFFGLGKVGELSIIHWLKKEGLSTGQATTIALLDKVITFFSLLLLSIIGFVFFFQTTQSILWIGFGILVLGMVLFGLLTETGRRIGRKILGKQSQQFEGFGKTIRLFLKEHPDTLLLNLLLTLGRWITQAFFTVFLYYSFGFNASVVEALFMIAVATLISLPPISLNGLGIKEAGFALLAVERHWPLVATGSVLAVSLALNYGLLLLVLLFFAKKIKQEEKQ